LLFYISNDNGGDHWYAPNSPPYYVDEDYPAGPEINEPLSP